MYHNYFDMLDSPASENFKILTSFVLNYSSGSLFVKYSPIAFFALDALLWFYFVIVAAGYISV